MKLERDFEKNIMLTWYLKKISHNECTIISKKW